jgi:hypothetical protein
VCFRAHLEEEGRLVIREGIGVLFERRHELGKGDETIAIPVRVAEHALQAILGHAALILLIELGDDLALDVSNGDAGHCS